ncbi:Leucine-rich repeat [Dillenia turbinata]|uniref:Leucine-rich repeat n=1 Tax=Dillenia turbinata TaxID=194707 RepID=A0AAN8VTC4_9MAGN
MENCENLGGGGGGGGGVSSDQRSSDSDIDVTIKFSGRSISLSLSQDSTIRDLKSLLQPLTNVLPRGQKLIFKGKVLIDDMSLRSSSVMNGSKIMLMASQGVHQGDGPIVKESPLRMNIRREAAAKPSVSEEQTIVFIQKKRVERWKATGIIALSQSNLKTMPDEVWDCGASARVLDVSNNKISSVPENIGFLTSLQKLSLSANYLCDGCISWEGLASLKSLKLLSLSQNNITALPSALGALTSLTNLDVSQNKLTYLPVEIGDLTQLEVLKASYNRLSTVPFSIGECSSLIEVDLSSNLLNKLPETIGKLQKLKALHLKSNGLKFLPTTIFKMCLHLSTLDLHGTEITTDQIRQLEGWEDFDERRRSKHQKQLDFHVEGDANFDEGADKNW